MLVVINRFHSNAACSVRSSAERLQHSDRRRLRLRGGRNAQCRASHSSLSMSFFNMQRVPVCAAACLVLPGHSRFLPSWEGAGTVLSLPTTILAERVPSSVPSAMCMCLHACALSHCCADAPCLGRSPWPCLGPELPALPHDIWAHIYNIRAATTIQAIVRGRFVRRGPLRYVRLYIQKRGGGGTATWRRNATRAYWLRDIRRALARIRMQP